MGRMNAATGNPGSWDAWRDGCTCDALGNNYGDIAPYGPDGWLIEAGCPLHDRRDAAPHGAPRSPRPVPPTAGDNISTVPPNGGGDATGGGVNGSGGAALARSGTPGPIAGGRLPTEGGARRSPQPAPPAGATTSTVPPGGASVTSRAAGDGRPVEGSRSPAAAPPGHLARRRLRLRVRRRDLSAWSAGHPWPPVRGNAMTFTAISYGGGVQSTALVVLAATGHIHADVALFANVGDDSEHPATLAYVRDIATPWAAERGLAIHELHRERRDGTTETLMGRLTRPGSRSLPIPVRMSDTGAPGTRSCTQDFKIKVLGRWLKARGHGKTLGAADVLIGISVDEIERAGRGRNEAHETRRYPLLDLGLTRAGCEQVIRDAGLPVPPKSACYFCPFHRPQMWAEMRRDEPELFDRSQALEDLLNERRSALGKDPVYLTRFGRRLSDAITEAQAPLFDGDGSDIGEAGCDEGVCFV